MKAMRISTSLLGLALVILLACTGLSDGDSRDKKLKHYNIVLLGATGDLAKRYLWKALFQLYTKEASKGKTQFSIYACGRSDPTEGRMELSQILLGVLQCYDDTCRTIKRQFVEATQYVQTKNESNFKTLGNTIAENTQSIYGLQGESFTHEKGRLVYFSIPPTAYSLTAQAVNKHLRPRQGYPWFRVVLEKPFGHDTSSAKNLARKLAKYFKEEEIYRIDHYLGKSISKLILPFRYKNQELYGSIWNYNYIERIEVVLKEKIDVQGRFTFYEEVGVIRDVMQNHLMELLQLITMELPSNSGNIQEILQAKLRVLQEMRTPGSDNTLIAQYDTYADQARKELNKTGVVKTPTFAASLFYIDNARWQDVPIILMSGKKLNSKDSYVRVVFKDAVYCVSQTDECFAPKQIVFHISSGDLLRPPMILISKTLPKPTEFLSWRFESINTNITFFGQAVADMYQLMAENEHDAYITLLEAVYNADRHMFTNNDNLLASWNIWTPILKSLNTKMPRLYQGEDDDMHMLDFVIKGNNLEYVVASQKNIIDVKDQQTFSQIPATFLESPLISGNLKTLISKLADDVFEKAKQSVADKGVFHLAVSGGESPKPLLLQLASAYLLFPWRQTHIWLVDERCEPLDNDTSNFKLLETNLLQLVSVPYLNIHPMPVHIHEEACEARDEGDILYEATIKRLIPDNRFDYLILGMGNDGHTASLFPWQPSLQVKERLVIYSTARPENEDQPVTRRMTLTYTAINQARHISVLVTGKKKHSILHSISEDKVDINQYPIRGVSPTNGTLSWYIDHKALLEPQLTPS